MTMAGWPSPKQVIPVPADATLMPPMHLSHAPQAVTNGVQDSSGPGQAVPNGQSRLRSVRGLANVDTRRILAGRPHAQIFTITATI